MLDSRGLEFVQVRSLSVGADAGERWDEPFALVNAG